jgi:hypothetical protein
MQGVIGCHLERCRLVNSATTPSPGRAAARVQAHSPGFTLGIIAVVIAMLAVGLAYAIDAAARNRGVPAEGTLSRSLGSATLNIPVAWFREAASTSEGFSKQVDLRLRLPLGPDAAVRTIDVTLMPRSRVRPSAALLDGVYLHQFAPEQLSGPPGLIGKPLQPVGGFAGETVWYDALSASPFVAKCSAPLAEGLPSRCLRVVYLGPGIAAVYGFDADVLGAWQSFDAQLKPLMQRIGALPVS